MPFYGLLKGHGFRIEEARWQAVEQLGSIAGEPATAGLDAEPRQVKLIVLTGLPRSDSGILLKVGRKR